MSTLPHGTAKGPHWGGRKSRHQRKNGPVRPSYPQARHHGPGSEGGERDGPSV